MLTSELLKSPYNVSSDACLQPYRGGVRLVNPGDESLQLSQLKDLYSLPYSVYFFSNDNKFISCNDINASLFSAVSPADMAGRKPGCFVARELSDLLCQNNFSVMHNMNRLTIEEAGDNLESEELAGVSYKYPWYHNDTIIGVFGFSVILKPFNDVLQSQSIEKLLSLISKTPPARGDSIRPGVNYCGVYFTKREATILSHAIERYSAKETAERLFLSRRTVEHYLARIKSKLGVTSKAELIEKVLSVNLPVEN